MTLNQIAALAADTTFQGQVRGASVNEALSVMSESASSPPAAEIKRRALAFAVITDGGNSLLPRFVWGIAATPGFVGIVNDTGDQNDAAIESAMVSQWNDFAGVLPGDLGIGTQGGA